MRLPFFRTRARRLHYHTPIRASYLSCSVILLITNSIPKYLYWILADLDKYQNVQPL